MKGEVGLVGIEMEGDEKEIERGIKWLEEMGIEVKGVEQDIIEP